MLLQFDYVRPKSIAETIGLLVQHGSSSAIKAGGTDLIVWMKKHLIKPVIVIDITGIAELSGVFFYPHKGLRIGANATINQVLANREVKRSFPAIYDACLSHSDRLIRNKATFVGNVTGGVPSADLVPSLCCYDAVVHIAGPDGERDVPILEFITGPRRTVLSKEELVTHIYVPYIEAQAAGCYVKLARRNALDLAQASVACVVVDKQNGKDFRISCGAVAPKPVRALEAEKYLKGTKTLDETAIRNAADKVAESVNPITDVRATREYRLDMIRELTIRALTTCIEGLRGGRMS
ncbi:MAG TPA: xanthine dehydrogenase family protein subunit M [Acetomicrobium flavidum]|uniref:FAD binding domain-containing protein n=1 Tax=Acetomicrobium flavidum TaxID=49896 RepID=UPI002C227489|nr:xanthine dehydrogenase family protein subunit M [Acetomicrobium flavidum]